jgi:hypothetical protein
MSPTTTAPEPQPNSTTPDAGTPGTAPVGCVRYADVAQLAEHRFCKPGVAGSIPAVGSTQRRGILAVTLQQIDTLFDRRWPRLAICWT